MNAVIYGETHTKKPRLRRRGRAWLKRAEAFKMFLEEHPQAVLELPSYIKNSQNLMGLNQMIVEEHYRELRENAYYTWLQNAESLMYQEIPFKNGVIRLMMGLDYKKFYDALLFEFHHYLNRACFCKLAQYYGANINARVLEFELEYLIGHLKTLFQENRGLHNQEDFKALFVHAYRGALVDLCLYHNVKANVLEEPIFFLSGLMHKDLASKRVIDNQVNNKPSNLNKER